MLALTVRAGDYVTIGDDIVVQVLKTGELFRIAIDAPRSLSIRRGSGSQEISQLPEAIQRARLGAANHHAREE
jgi:carbon storage regulator CsrA